MPHRKRLLFVCVNRRPDGTPKGSCAARGSEELYKTLKEAVKASGLAKTEVRVCSSSCLDACWAGPTIAVEPDHFYYGRVTTADVPDIVEALAKQTRVDRLVLTAEDFEDPQALPK